jgi:hypothetical protein
MARSPLMGVGPRTPTRLVVSLHRLRLAHRVQCCPLVRSRGPRRLELAGSSILSDRSTLRVSPLIRFVAAADRCPFEACACRALNFSTCLFTPRTLVVILRSQSDLGVHHQFVIVAAADRCPFEALACRALKFPACLSTPRTLVVILRSQCDLGVHHQFVITTPPELDVTK